MAYRTTLLHHAFYAEASLILQQEINSKCNEVVEWFKSYQNFKLLSFKVIFQLLPNPIVPSYSVLSPANYHLLAVKQSITHVFSVCETVEQEVNTGQQKNGLREMK